LDPFSSSSYPVNPYFGRARVATSTRIPFFTKALDSFSGTKKPSRARRPKVITNRKQPRHIDAGRQEIAAKEAELSRTQKDTTKQITKERKNLAWAIEETRKVQANPSIEVGLLSTNTEINARRYVKDNQEAYLAVKGTSGMHAYPYFSSLEYALNRIDSNRARLKETEERIENEIGAISANLFKRPARRRLTSQRRVKLLSSSPSQGYSVTKKKPVSSTRTLGVNNAARLTNKTSSSSLFRSMQNFSDRVTDWAIAEYKKPPSGSGGGVPSADALTAGFSIFC
jgi:hypothetical protein